MNPTINRQLEELKKSVLVFDIETCSTDPATREPIDISTHFDDYVKYAKCKWFGCYSFKTGMYNAFEVVGHEQIIYDLLAEHDVLCGFNSEEFDTPILYNNNLVPEEKRYIQVDCQHILGASNHYDRNGRPYKNRGALMGFKFPSRSLKNMAKTMELETQKGDIDYKIFFKDEYTADERNDIFRYLRSDVLATKELFEKLWEYWMPFTNFLDEKNIMNLSWIRSSIASLTYKAACKVLDVEDTYAEKSDQPKEEMGGRVIAPKYEESRRVWYVDYASLYPHMFAMFNLFAETSPMGGGGLAGAWHGNDVFQVKGYYDIREQHPLSLDIADNIKWRMRLKKEDPSNPMIYTIKIKMNALYGVARSEIFEQVHTENCGWDCCWLGQQINELTEDMMKEFGFETIAGDTDSVFLIAEKDEYDNRAYVKECLAKVIKKITDNVPFPTETFSIDIENFLEYVKWPFSLEPIVGPDGKNLKNEKGRLIKERRGKKKNYLYLYRRGNELKLKIVGLPIIKDNATKLGKKLLEESIIPMILEDEHASFFRNYIENVIETTMSNRTNWPLLAREFRVKPARSYKKESQIQAQISMGYFNGEDGVISLIKNNKAGRAGKTAKYCTVEEAEEFGLELADFDLVKLRNELEPFVEVE